jgi:hypothetical protein
MRAFQLADDFVPPIWPAGERPQQFHLDLTVEDVDAVDGLESRTRVQSPCW